MPRPEFESSIFDSRNQPPTRFMINKPKEWSLKGLRTMLHHQIQRAPIRQIMIISKKRVTTLESNDLNEVRKKKGKALRDFLNTYANRMWQARSVIIDTVNPLRNFIEKDLSLNGI